MPSPEIRLSIGGMAERRGAWISAAAGISLICVIAAGWKVRDGIRALLSRDYAARLEVLRLVEERRTSEHRKLFRVEVPDVPVPLPRTYQLDLYGRYLDTQLLAIRFDARDGVVTAEMASKQDLLAGRVPASRIEKLLRMLYYLKTAGEHRLIEDGEEQSLSMFQSHSPQYTVELKPAGGSQEGFEHASAGQAFQDTIEAWHEFDDFIHSWLCREVRGIAEESLAPIDPAQREATVLGVLGSTEVRPGDEGLPRELILAEVHAHLAAEWRIARALPLLERLGFSLDAKRLSITTAADPRPRLKEALLEVDRGREGWPFSVWALDYLVESVQPAWRKEVLLDALERSRDDSLKEFIIDDLSLLPADPQVESALRCTLESEGEAGWIRLKAAASLLRVAGDPVAFERLSAAALSPPGNEHLASDLQQMSVEALVAYAVDNEASRDRVADLILSLLSRVSSPEGDSSGRLGALLEELGKLKRPADEEVFARYLNHTSDSVVGTVIFALARTHPQRAVAEARRRLRLYAGSVGDEHSYRSNVYEYLWLFCAFEAREAEADIEAARAALAARDENRTWHEEPKRIEAVLRFLRARSLAERIREASALVKAYPDVDEGLLSHLRERFEKEGARPGDLVGLSRTPVHRKRSTVGW